MFKSIRFVAAACAMFASPLFAGVSRNHVANVMYAAQAANSGFHERKFLLDSISLPVSSEASKSYGIDLNGDGYADNNFGKLVTVFASQNIEIGTSVNAAIADGSSVQLVVEQSADSGFSTDPDAAAVWYVGNALAQPPLFDGTDQPTYDINYLPGMFLSALVSGNFTSPNPATTSTPVALTLILQLGQNKIVLPLQGARLSFTTDDIGYGHMQGQLNGSIRHDDYMASIPPALAAWFTAKIQPDPTSPEAVQIKALFDTGCNGIGADDNVIEVCELTGSSLVVALLAPDVQIRDGNGNYAPNPANTSPDANSLGIRFTAVRLDKVFSNGFER